MEAATTSTEIMLPVCRNQVLVLKDHEKRVRLFRFDNVFIPASAKILIVVKADSVISEYLQNQRMKKKDNVFFASSTENVDKCLLDMEIIYVINYDLPDNIEEHVNPSGKTTRACSLAIPTLIAQS